MNEIITAPRAFAYSTAWPAILSNSGYFFSKGAMRFFNSRILWATLSPTAEGFAFITSEQFDHNSPRLYTVREWRVSTSSIEELSDFQQFETRAQAVAHLKSFAL